MLVKGNILHSEPVVSIGLVLPNDKQTELVLSVSSPHSFKFLIDSAETKITEKDLTIMVTNNELDINGNHVEK